MRGATAEAPVLNPTTDFYDQGLRLVPDPETERPVRLASESEYEADVQVRFNQWLGAVTLSEAGVEAPAAHQTNILERLKAARQGSPEALKSIQTNIDTAVFEAMFKEGYVGVTFMERDSDGQVSQFGQDNDSIYQNGINCRPGRDPVLKRITEVEALNRHRIEAELDAGNLRDHHYIVFSLVPEGVDEEQLGPKGDGYFLDSLSMNIQSTSELPDGRIKIETGFMAGVEAAETDNFKDRAAKRHDFKAVARIYEWFGLEAPETAEEALNKSLKVPAAMMPNGVADIMRWVDIASDEVLGRAVDRKPEDYLGLRLESKRKEASLKDVRRKVLEDLLGESGRFVSPMEASKRMWQLIRKHTLKDSVNNMHIDPRVFGKAAPDIIAARYYARNGDINTAGEFMSQAEKRATITGCGGGSSSTESSKQSDNEDGDEAGLSKSEKGTMKCVNCPKCRTFHEELKAKEGVFKCKNPKCGHTAKAG